MKRIAAVSASWQCEVSCRRHGIPFVPKSTVIGSLPAVEGTVKVCPSCLAENRATVAAMRMMAQRRRGD